MLDIMKEERRRDTESASVYWQRKVILLKTISDWSKEDPVSSSFYYDNKKNEENTDKRESTKQRIPKWEQFALSTSSKAAISIR